MRLSPVRSLYKAFGGRSEADLKWNVRVRGGTGGNLTVKDVRPEVRESVIGVGRETSERGEGEEELEGGSIGFLYNSDI